MSKTINLDFKKTPEQTIAFLKDKKITTSFDYKELQHEAHHKAFTVAKIMQLDVLADIQGSLITAMKEGKSFKKWKKELKPLLIKKGWYGKKEVINPTTGEIKETYIGSRRLRTIFETNMRTAHAKGRANNIYNSINEYIQYSAILDSKTRPDHRSLHGIVKHRNDKFWEKNFPPNGWGCRCYIKSLSKKDLERKDLKVDTNDYGDISDKEFAYDLRALDKEALENTYYEKAMKLSQNCIELNAKGMECNSSKKAVKNAIEWISSINRKKEFKTYVNKIKEDNSYFQNIIAAGAIDYTVFEFLKSKDLEPQKAHIHMRKKDLTHMLRDSKKSGLSLEELEQIPTFLQKPDQILYDNNDPALLYIFNDTDKVNKIVIRVNYLYKKKIYNMITTATKVNEIDIQKDLDSGVFQKIK